MSHQFDKLRPDKLRFETRLTIFKKHFDNLMKIFIKFIKSFTLRMSTWKTGNVTDEQTGFRTFLNYCGETMSVHII